MVITESNGLVGMDRTTTAVRIGEEFRDDARGALRTAGDVRRMLPPEELQPLTELDPLRSTLALTLTLGSLMLIIGIAATHWAWWTALLAVLLIAPLQHALFVLAHDAAHYRLYQSRWLNDAVGRFVGTGGGEAVAQAVDELLDAEQHHQQTAERDGRSERGLRSQRWHARRAESVAEIDVAEHH